MKQKKPPSKPSVERVVFISFLVDISDLLINLFIAIISGSVVMLSQALQGGTDLLSSTLLLIGVHRSKKQTDKNYPFGRGRELYFWNMIAAMVMLGITAALSIIYGINRVKNPEPINNLELSIFILGLALFTNSYSFWLSAVRLFKGHKINAYFRIIKNSPFIETKTVFIQDLMGAIASLIGIIALVLYTITGNNSYDGYGAIGIGFALAALSIFLLDGLRQMILGRSASPNVEERIRKAVEKSKDVNEVVDLKTMYLGNNKILAIIYVNLNDNLKTNQIEKIIDHLKDIVKKDVPSAAHVQIELETP